MVSPAPDLPILKNENVGRYHIEPCLGKVLKAARGKAQGSIRSAGTYGETAAGGRVTPKRVCTIGPG